MPTSIDECTRLQTLFKQLPASLPDSAQARSCRMHQPSKLSLLWEQAADANATAKAKVKGQKCYKEQSLEKVVEAVDSPWGDSECFNESSEEMTSERSSDGDDFVPNAELADLLPCKTIPETDTRLGPQSAPRATASAASSVIQVEGKKRKHRSKKVLQSHHKEEKPLDDELPQRNDYEPTNKKKKTMETEELCNDAEIDPMSYVARSDLFLRVMIVYINMLQSVVVGTIVGEGDGGLIVCEDGDRSEVLSEPDKPYAFSQDIGAPLNVNTQPVVDFRSSRSPAKSASVYPTVMTRLFPIPSSSVLPFLTPPLCLLRSPFADHTIKAQSTSFDRLGGSSLALSPPRLNPLSMFLWSDCHNLCISCIQLSLFPLSPHLLRVRSASPLPSTTPPLCSLRSPFATFAKRPFAARIIHQQAHHQTQSTSSTRHDGSSLAPSSSQCNPFRCSYGRDAFTERPNCRSCGISPADEEFVQGNIYVGLKAWFHT
ncbi:hypothetical protein JB92DRAFT_3112139 [Gautieria morchelliformis]|nr:hypothetical protein JB92DRAFT_3112139 [Gautieria morchelliformis]